MEEKLFIFYLGSEKELYLIFAPSLRVAKADLIGGLQEQLSDPGGRNLIYDDLGVNWVEQYDQPSSGGPIRIDVSDL